jgi:imidazolonepropionase-like amidohydrolase
MGTVIRSAASFGKTLAWLAACFLLLAIPAPTPAAEEPPAAGLPFSSDPAPSSYQPLPRIDTLIIGATVLDGAGGRFAGDVLVRDGKIVELGPRLKRPAGITIVDASGRWLTPGLVDVHTHYGTYPIPQDPGGGASDVMEDSGANVADTWVEHAVRPVDPAFGRALAGGVTTLQVVPGSQALFAGRTVVLKPVPAVTVQAMKFPGAPQGLKMACGENPKRVYAGRGPTTRMANVAGYRAAWIEAQAYRERWDRWLANSTGDPPTRNLGLETLADVLRGHILVHNHCYRADEMAQMIDLAKEFGYTIRSFHHSVEAYKVADLLLTSGIAASMWSDWGGFKMEALDSVRGNLALVHAAGARAIVHSDDPIGAQRLNQDAAKGAAAGRALGIDIPETESIRWITVNPAWALGIDKQVGSLEVGKQADVVLWSGNPFSVYTKADEVWVDGVLRYDRRTAAWRTDFELGYVRPREVAR